MRFSCRLREDVPEERAVIRWLVSASNQSDAVRAVLVAHVANQGGASLLAINDKLDRVLALLRSGVAVGSSSPVIVGPGDGLDYLDELGV